MLYGGGSLSLENVQFILARYYGGGGGGSPPATTLARAIWSE